MADPVLSTAPTPNPTSTTFSTAFRPVARVEQIKTKLDKNSAINALQFPLDRPKYFTMLNMAEYSRQNLFRLGDLNTLATIVLPLPQNMMDTHQVDYEETPLGQFAGAVTSAAMNKAAGGSFMKALNDAKGALTTTAGMAAGEALSGAIGVNAIGIYQAITGHSPNQFLTILLKGPQYKRHELSWVLSPRNEQEASNIRRIIQVFNNAMAPGLGLNGGIFTFPKIFDIGYMPNSMYLYKFKPAVLENMTVNYNPGGVPAFYRSSSITSNLNAPEGVEIRLRFMELEFWITGDFNDSNDPYDRRTGSSNLNSSTRADPPPTTTPSPSTSSPPAPPGVGVPTP